jgi:hypothetical protein
MRLGLDVVAFYARLIERVLELAILTPKTFGIEWSAGTQGLRGNRIGLDPPVVLRRAKQDVRQDPRLGIDRPLQISPPALEFH